MTTYDLEELNALVLPTLKEYALCPVHQCWHDADKHCVSCASALLAKRRDLLHRQTRRRKCAVASIAILASGIIVYCISAANNLR